MGTLSSKIVFVSALAHNMSDPMGAKVAKIGKKVC